MRLNAAARLLGSQKLGSHSGRILLLGFGGVGQSMLPLVLRHIAVAPSSITVMDKVARPEFKGYAKLGIRYVVRDVVESNMADSLSEFLQEGDYLINLSLNIDGVAIVEWCLQHGVLYIDTSIEHWGTHQDEVIPKLADRTLHASHVALREMAVDYPNSATCIVAHGANPGLVSHLAKAALLKLATDTGLETPIPESQEEWAALSEATGTKIIQIAERDTQILRAPKRVHEFVNTWSCEGFWCEGRAPAEFGWGTHETVEPEGLTLQGEGCAFLDEPGVAVLVKSWVPKGGTFNGFLVQHSESLMLSEYLSTDNYRPTVYYAYQPTDAALASIHEMRGQELWLHRNTRVAKNSILSGTDELGVLLLGHSKNALWYGSQLDIDEARRLIPGQNATTVQVVASMLGAIVWTLQNPQRGYCEPEDLPFDFVLNIAQPYLGPMAAIYSDWNPLDNRGHLYKKEYDEDNEWSFVNFMVGK